MTEVKKSRGRVSRYGKNNENVANIAADLAKVESGDLTFFYIEKLIAMGLVEIKLTTKGQNMMDNHK